ncbi:flagellar hook-associated 2 domain protein [Syntrophothermus lipocalidus DSM 12680]|uniref:Flagellar hook-associated protein 2 n=2 Tax=Syntrophothermus TaxID=129001 RepID=D7CPM2_SYNLT|nr:flagellar hook-associated 2 domain protein [Syntrophothermus lipocalidus DSM 12680]
MVTRITGLASGIDIDQWVSDLMKAERTRVDTWYQKRQVLEWQREDYRNINTKLLALRNATFDLKLQGSFQSKTATSSDTSVLTASAGTSAVAGTYTVKVNSLASGVYKSSTESLADEQGTSGTKTLAEQFGLSGTVTFTLEGTVNGEAVSKYFSFDTSTANIYTVVSEINKANIGIKASYDSTLNRFFLVTGSTGSQAKITVKADDQGFLRDKLKLGVELNTTYQGTNASIDFNDLTGLEFSTNQFTVAGITFNLKSTSASTVTVSVGNDTEAVVEKIKAWVNAYNDAVGLMFTELNEERYRDYQPLTDDQKKEMKESDIEKWEAKARSGLLRGDSLLYGVYSRVRSAAMARVEGLSGSYTSLSAVGITTGSYREGGKLYLDESKLRQALAQDTEGVMNLFTKTSETSSGQGLAVRLYDELTKSMKLITDKAGSGTGYYDSSTIGREISRINTTIDKLEDRLKDMEDRYYRQFEAMEQAIQRMNQQSMWLAMQFGGSSQQQ